MTQREELQTVIGKECTDNWSPTLSSILVKINKHTCTLKITPNPRHLHLNKTAKAIESIGKTFLCPIAITWNGYFF